MNKHLKQLYINLFPVLLWILIAYLILFGVPLFFNRNSLFVLSNWDGNHFLEISKNGYQYFWQYAFYPLYPLMINIFSRSGLNSYLAASVINLVSTVFIFYFFLKLLGLLNFRGSYIKALLAFLLFPASFFFLTDYSESIFILLSVLSFWSFFRQKIFLASLFVGLAILTRPVGICLFFAFLIEIIFYRKKFSELISFLPSFLGLLILVFFFSLKTSVLAPILAESYWQRELVFNPGFGVFLAIWGLVSNISLNEKLKIILELSAVIFALGVFLRGLRFLPRVLNIYTGAVLILPLLTNTISSYPRFVLAAFPIFITLGLIKQEKIFLGICFTWGVLSVILMSLFSLGYFVS